MKKTIQFQFNFKKNRENVETLNYSSVKKCIILRE